jgi:hypothetical protein
MNGPTILLFMHPTFGVLAIMASVWVFVEALNASAANAARIRIGGMIVAVCISAAYVLGGYWYTHFYAPEKAIILKGPVPWAHNLIMETKEHAFFIPLVLALYLAIVTRQKLTNNPTARAMVLSVAALVFLSGFAIEGAGAIINFGVKAALMTTGVQGAE